MQIILILRNLIQYSSRLEFAAGDIYEKSHEYPKMNKMRMFSKTTAGDNRDN